MAAANGMAIINRHIEEGGFSGVYLLYGNEKYLITQYRQKLIDALISPDDTMNLGIYKGTGIDADSLGEFAATMPFFAERRVLLIEDSGFFKKGNDAVADMLGALPDTTVVVFSETDIDKRNRLYKLVEKHGTVALFDTPDERTLLVWLKSLFTKEQIKVEDAAVYRLIESVGMDMNHLVNEAEKLKGYCIEKGIVSLADVEKLSVNQIEGKVFDMMDALSKRDKKSVMALYNDLMQLREPPMRLLALITRQFNLLLKAKLVLEQGGDYAKAAAVLKVPAFAVKKYAAQCKGYTRKELLARLELCQRADSDIKTGRKKDNLAVEMLIVQLLDD